MEPAVQLPHGGAELFGNPLEPGQIHGSRPKDKIGSGTTATLRALLAGDGNTYSCSIVREDIHTGRRPGALRFMRGAASRYMRRAQLRTACRPCQVDETAQGGGRQGTDG